MICIFPHWVSYKLETPSQKDILGMPWPFSQYFSAPPGVATALFELILFGQWYQSDRPYFPGLGLWGPLI